MSGIEPNKSAKPIRSISRDLQLQQFRSTVLAPLIEIGGDEGNRTLDPLLAGQVLSQLSYTPIFVGTQAILKIEA